MENTSKKIRKDGKSLQILGSLMYGMMTVLIKMGR